MGSGFQLIARWLSLAGAIAVDHVPGVGSSAEAAKVDVSIQWAPQIAPRNNGRKRPGEVSHLSSRWIRLSYGIIDLFLLCLNGFVALLLRFSGNPSHKILSFHGMTKLGLPSAPYAAFLLLYAVVLLLFCQSQDLYRTVRTRTAKDESFAVLKAVLFATLLLSAFVYLSGVKIVSRLVVAYAGALNVGTFILWRLWKRKIILRRVSKGIGTRNVLIVGAGRIGQAFAAHLEANKFLGYSFKGFLDANHSTDPRLLGKIEDLSSIAKAEFVDELFISIPSERELVKRLAAEARTLRLAVKVVPDLYDGFGWNAPINHIGHFPVMELHWEPIPTLGLFFKRIIDVLGAGLSLIILSPVLLAIGTSIRWDSRGSAIYSSPRVGRKGRRFTCYKFRTMVTNADAMKDQLRYMNERNGPTFKIANDPRITCLGKFLRKYSLDELPQLWNVLKGEMSLVGPRPHPLDDYEQYQLDHLRRLDVKPGITGLWQITARRHPSFDANMHLDLEYIEHWNLWLDIRILLQTVFVLRRGEGQ